MMRRISEFLIGLVFGIGLILSGMMNPAKVIGFLDITGMWDPSLMFVMGGAAVIGFFGFRWAKTRGTSLFGRVISLNDFKSIDVKLITGSAIFGIGWGLSGYCPAPVIASIGTGEWKSALFVASMAVGMVLQSFYDRRSQV